jgi:hypothetical protein
MTKIIGILVVVLVIWGGYELFEMWNKYDLQKDIAEQDAASKHFSPDSLAGMPQGGRETYAKAQQHGAVGIAAWLKAYNGKVQDPRRAWIELDYVVAISHDDPAEAKKVFADVKARTPETSPIYFRIKELSKTYE